MAAFRTTHADAAREGLRTADLLARQLRSIPVVNAAIKVEDLTGGRKLLTAQLADKPWSRFARWVLPIRDRKRIELDPLSATVFSLCDGHRTIGNLIDIHKDEWCLSFMESRGMVLEFIKRLVARRIIVLIVPEEVERGLT